METTSAPPPPPCIIIRRLCGVLGKAALCLLPFLPTGETTAQTVQTLVSNTGQSGTLLNPNSSFPLGIKFTTGSSPATLTEMRLFVTTGNANTVVRIRDGSTTNPTGTVIATLSNPSTFTNDALNTFIAPAGITLAANTTYFLVLNDGVTNIANQAIFRVTNKTGQTGITGWSIANSNRSLISGSWLNGASIPRFEVRGSIIPPPDAPTGLSATAGDRQVALSWSDPGNSNISKYQYRQGTGTTVTWDSWTDISNSSATTTRHTVTGLTNGTEYSFQVRAVAVGSVNGTESATVTATPLVPEITIKSGTAVTEGTAAAFTVSASPVPASNLTVNLTVAEATGSNFVASNNKGMKTVDIPASSRSMTYTVATEDDNMDESNGSVTVTVRDGTGYTVGSPSEASVTVNDNDVPPPAKPTGFTATAGDEEVTLLWTDPKNSDITGYQFRQKAGSGSYGSWTPIANSDATTVTHTVSGLTNGVAHAFRIRAVAGSTNGVQSDEATATPRANSVPTVANMIPDQTAMVGTAFSYAFPENTFNDADGDPLNYMATRGDGTALPDWLDFDDATRTFSGTPQASDIGTLNIRVTASDDNGGTVSDAFDITVNAQPVVTIAAGTSPVTEGTAASFTVSASPMPASDLTVNLSVAEAAGSDFVASGNEGMKTVMIPASGSVTYTVATMNDDTDEPNGNVTVTVENGTGYMVGSTASATVMVNDDDEEKTLLAVEDTEEAIIFPNPSGRYLEVWSSVGGTFKIVSLSGKPILEGITNTKMDITSLQSGLYLVQLPDGRLLKFVRE